MRKDLRIGLGIGGVFLAILIVALVVRSHGKDPKQAINQNGAGEVIDAGGEPANDTTPPAGQAQSPYTTAGGETRPPEQPTDKVFGDPTPRTPRQAAATAGPADWDKLFNAGADGAAVTSTPPPAGRTGRNALAGIGLAGVDGAAAAPGGRMLDQFAAAGGNAARNARTTPPAPTANGRTYVVQQGDTFSSIARAQYGSDRYFHRLIDANPSVNPNALRPGTRIAIPEGAGATRTAGEARTAGARVSADAPTAGRGEYRIQSNDNLYTISQKLYGDYSKVGALYELNKQTIGSNPRLLKVGTALKLPQPPTVASGR